MDAARSARALSLLVLLSLLWSVSFALIKVGVATVPPLTLVAGRLILAAFILVVLVYAGGRRLPASGGDWAGFVMLGLIGNTLPFVLISYGEQHIDSGLAAILIGTMPLFTALFAHALTRDERLTVARATGVVAGFAGVALLAGLDALANLGTNALAQLAVTAAAGCYAAATVYARRLAHLSPLVIAAGTMIAATALAVPASLVVDRPWSLQPTSESLGAVILLGILCTALAPVVYFALVALAGAVFTSFVNYLIPPAGVVWGVVLLSESVEHRAFVALVLIVAGIALSRGTHGVGRASPTGAGP